MTVRAKFTLSAITHNAGGGKTYKFFPVHDNSTPENARFTKYTPSGELTMLVDNPAVEGSFVLGKEYYVDFSPAE